MWNVARRPRWIAMLVLCLAVAAAFALLGQWQLERSVDEATVIDRDTETVQPIDRLTEPQRAVTEAMAGHVVSATGAFVPGEFTVLSDRQQDGESGYWLVGQFRVGATEAERQTGPSLAVAIGWAPTSAELDGVIDRLPDGPLEITGRYLPSEAPTDSDFENGEHSSLAIAALINQWQSVDDVYGGYLVLHDDVGQQLISSPKPSEEVQLNWLNIFYAAEWVIFAGFAIYLWYRLVKDAWERELEEAAELAAQQSRDPQKVD
ncbi:MULTISPECIES: SURF1 family protein [unclassified Salinibacterium]|uniref:SURF1 family protein n=1 Tax=unclassified Salinibacterium TaxID=2632331 RepID=UPI00141ED73D|nr:MULTISPECIES: SURF1 family protein [unclassified Salinibacterium]